VLHSCIVPLETKRFALLPWTGSRIHRTLAHVLHYIGWCPAPPQFGHYIEIAYDGGVADMLTELRKLSPQMPQLVSTLVRELKDIELWQGKYDYLAPRALLEKAYINDVLDIPGTVDWLATCS
jgi:hypothetical protein